MGVGVAFTLALLLVYNPDFSPDDSSALVEGRVELGYEYVGYIISDQNKVCAAALLDKNTILTAAHCLKFGSGNQYKFGTGAFTTNNSELADIVLVKFAPGFDPNTGQGPDLAVAKISKDINLSKYPEVALPKEKCDSSIVAYGAGIKDKAVTTDMFQKKSGEGCVKSISNTFLIRFGEEVGMCYGDSGGPIFYERGSDLIVGVLSGGLVEPELNSISCDPGNTGLAYNPGYYTDFIRDLDFTDVGDAKVRVLETGEIENLSENLLQFIQAAQQEENVEQTSSSGITLSDSPGSYNFTFIILGFMGVFVVGLIVISVSLKR